MTYERVKFYYENGFWGIAQVKMAAQKEVITPEQYQEITGEEWNG